MRVRRQFSVTGSSVPHVSSQVMAWPLNARIPRTVCAKNTLIYSEGSILRDLKVFWLMCTQAGVVARRTQYTRTEYKGVF